MVQSTRKPPFDTFERQQAIQRRREEASKEIETDGTPLPAVVAPADPDERRSRHIEDARRVLGHLRPGGPTDVDLAPWSKIADLDRAGAQLDTLEPGTESLALRGLAVPRQRALTRSSAAEEDANIALTEFFPLIEPLYAETVTEAEVDQALTGITQQLNAQLDQWRRDFPNPDDFNQRYAYLGGLLSNALDSAGLQGYQVRLDGSGNAGLYQPVVRSTGKFSGTSRSDKLQDMAPGWESGRAPTGPEGMTLVREVTLDYGANSQAVSRTPGQSSSMGTVDHPSLDPYLQNGTVSPNAVRGTNIEDQRRSSEWLHLVANHDGNGLQFGSVPGQDGFGFPEAISNKAQDPRNLVLGSFGANTLMLALESVGSAAENRGEYSKTVRAYSNDPNQPHQADLIEYTITHKESGSSRTYYIDASKDSYGLLADYADMERDAAAFMAGDHSTQTNTTYEYLSADKVQRLMNDYGDGTNNRAMRQAVAVERAAEDMFGGPSNIFDHSGVKQLYEDFTAQHGEPKFAVDPNLDVPVAWDRDTNTIVFAESTGAHGLGTQFDDPDILQARIAYAMISSKYADQPPTGSTPQDFARNEMATELQIIDEHKQLFAADDPRNIYKGETATTVDQYIASHPDRYDFYLNQYGASSGTRGGLYQTAGSTERGTRRRHDGAGGFLFPGFDDEEFNLALTGGDETTIQVDGRTYDVRVEGGVAIAGVNDESETSGTFRIYVQDELSNEELQIDVTVGEDGYLQASIDHQFKDGSIAVGAAVSAGLRAFGELQKHWGELEFDGEVAVGAGVSFDAGGSLTFNGLPGASASLGFEAGYSAGVQGTLGTDNASVTLDAGVIDGVALGGSAAFGEQPDGKFHIELDARLALGVGGEVGIDLAFDTSHIRDEIKSFFGWDDGGGRRQAALTTEEKRAFVVDLLHGTMTDYGLVQGDPSSDAYRSVQDVVDQMTDEQLESFFEPLPFSEEVHAILDEHDKNGDGYLQYGGRMMQNFTPDEFALLAALADDPENPTDISGADLQIALDRRLVTFESGVLMPTPYLRYPEEPPRDIPPPRPLP